jgi:TonB-dependent SusC/RagA subfamily outer membrane receptor
MNEDCRKRGLSNKKILTVVAISTLLLSSGNVIATQTTIDGSLRVTEQLQTQIVNGLVVDVNGEPVIGASVVEKGTTNGGITDINGKFTLNVKPGSTLQISFVGYQTQEIKATKTVKVVLKEDSELLSEVVVVGYGTQKKANLTGAVATVDVNKTLDSRPIADIGSDPLIKIRGQIGSISGNNTPLILLDNVEIPSIQMVNPNDVQSISVLKDAASSSIYGSKAAFGVILITTKSGAQTDKFEVSYSNNFSWQDPAKSIEIGGIEALQYTLDAQINRGEPMPAGGFWRISPEMDPI